MRSLLRKLHLLTFAFLLSQTLQGQLLVQPVNNAQQIADGIEGVGVEIFNPVLDCAPGGAGGFVGVNSAIQIDSGLILSTGLVTDAMPPVQGPNIGSNMGFPGDTLLSLQADTVQSYDKCVFRFKAVPMAGFMKLQYTFASEEYPEKICCPDRDQFGIFVSGVNPNPNPIVGPVYNYTNVCLNTNVNPPGPIELSTASNGVAGPGCFCPPQVPIYNTLYVSNPFGLTEEFDGFTVNIEAIFPVVPCDTYDIRLAVADIFDAVGDSYLLIEASSVSSGGYELSNTAVSGDTFLVEGCSPGQIVIDRDARDTAATSILLSYGGSAVNGVDVSTLPTNPTFASQSSSISIPVNAIADNTIEGEEELVVYLMHPCTGNRIDSTTLYIRDELPVQAFPDTTVCEGEPVRLFAIGAANFSWSPPTYLNNPSAQAPISEPGDTIVYTVTGSSGSCSNTDSITIITSPIPAISAGNDTAVCAGETGQLKGFVESGSTPLWSPPNGLAVPTLVQPVVFTQQSTRYILTATSPDGCIASDTMIYRVNPRPTVRTNQLVNICPGDTAILTASGAENYVWDADPALLDTVGDSVRAIPTSNQRFYVTGIDSNGCSRGAFVDVQLFSPPSVNATAPSPICEGDTVWGTASGANTYTWLPASNSGGNGSNTALFPITTVTYTVIGTDANGCADTALLPITVQDAPTLQTSVSQDPVCVGDTVTLTVNGANTYTWTGPVNNPNSATTTAIIIDTTTFTVMGTDNIGCSSTDTVVVNTFSTPVISTGTGDSICIGGSIVLTASGGTQYQWSPSAGLSDPASATPTASPSTTTAYTVEVRDANGCLAVDSTTITVLPLPSINTGGTQTICENDTVQLQATGGNAYQWSVPGSLSCTTCPDPLAFPMATTTYTVIGTDPFGCPDTQTQQVVVNPLPTVTAITSNSPICQGDTVQLQATGAVQYTWSPATSLSSTSGASVQAYPQNSTVYTVIGVDANGCTNSGTVLVDLFVNPVVSGGANDTICVGQSIQLQASGGTVYQWTPATGLSDSTIANPVASPAASTTYTVTISDVNGCTATATKHIEVVSLPPVDAGPDLTMCVGDTLALSVSGANSFQWSGSSALSCTNCAQPSFWGAQNTTLVVEGFIGQGCSATDTLAITVNPLPAADAGSDTAVCTGDAVVLNGSGGSTYSWSPATGLSSTSIANPTATIGGSTTYTVTVTDNNNCTSSDTIAIIALPLPTINTAPDTTICENTIAVLQAFGANTYQWQPTSVIANPSSAITNASPSVTTVFTVTGVDGNGCENTATQQVNVQQAPDLTVSPAAVTLCPDSAITISVTGGNSYQWTPASGLNTSTGSQVIATPTTNVTYTVTSASSAGCAATGTVSITVQPRLNPMATPDSVAICEGETVALQAQNGQVYNWTPSVGLDDPSVATPNAAPSTTTYYTVTIADAVGCTFRDSIVIQVYPAAIAEAGNDLAMYAGQSIVLQGQGNGAFNWSPAASLNDPTIATPTATPVDDQVYTLTVITNGGCVASDTTFVDVLYETVIFVPNAFTPNGDGVNDEIRIRSANQFQLDRFVVFDRWGHRVFSTTDLSEAWDGTSNGDPLPAGTYMFWVRGRGNLGELIERKGNITLLR